MRVLLTGGSGFVGKYLKTNLGYQIISPNSKELDLLDEDQVFDFFSKNSIDAVIHCAVAGRDRVYDRDDKILENNLRMFYNLLSVKDYYKKFINFGSGAEFGLDKDIRIVDERMVQYCIPKESYGFSKNIIARHILKTDGFYNLRIFACLDPSEGPNRLITKFKNTVSQGNRFVIDQDRYVDFFTLEDVSTVVNAVLSDQIKDKDLNLVYQDKHKTSELLAKYCKIKGIDPSLIEVTGSGKEYTGNGTRLSKYNLNLTGLDSTLEKYKD